MKVLVTGVTGSLASALVPLLLEDGHSVVGVSRDELKQSQMPKREKQTLYLCDVRDRDRLLEASRGADLLIHAAAMKRIECCEEQPEEAVGINILGTQNVLYCQRMNKIPRVVLVSTDKGCLPITTYGYTKAVAESLVLRNPNNQVVRYGNVLGSRGSVVPYFAATIKKENALYITDRRCTRYFWTLREAAEFVYLASKRPVGGLCIPDLKATPIVMLGYAIAEALGKTTLPAIVQTGLRCREKLHEDLRTEDEGGARNSGNRAEWFSPVELKDKVMEALEGIA